jgi:hypothetical protein
VTASPGRRPGPRARLKRRITFWRRDHPPKCPEGWVTGPPDFIGVGAQKAGTSWWHHLVASHPSVSDLVRPKELQFALRLREPHPQTELYYRHFPRKPGTLAGEFTPEYMLPPGPLLLHGVAPDAKLIVLLRDPIARFESGVTMDARRLGRVTLQTMAEQERRSRYGELVAGILDHYPADHVLVLQYERCVADTRANLATTFEFLGIESTFVPDGLDRVHNRTTSGKVELTPDERAEFAARLAPDLARLTEVAPSIDLSLWPTAALAGV